MDNAQVYVDDEIFNEWSKQYADDENHYCKMSIICICIRIDGVNQFNG